jgi:hypothetical protein
MFHIGCRKNNKIRITGDQICDQKVDCPDGEDEMGCDLPEDILKNVLNGVDYSENSENKKLGNNFKCIKAQRQSRINKFKIINTNNWLLVKGLV